MEERLRKIVLVTAALMWSATPALAQNGDGDGESDNFIKTLIGSLMGPGWNFSLNGGWSNTGRFLLQNTGGGERALRDEGGGSIGGAAGTNILPRTGFRLGYLYTRNDLVFRDDNGNGSENLDTDDLGKIGRHIASLEIVRYMLPARVSVTPYATIGLAASWWELSPETTLLQAPGGDTQFRMGAIGSFGVQFHMTAGFAARIEAATATVRNPFTGSQSYRAMGGSTIEEPSRVNVTDYRLALVYQFGTPILPVR